jgi:hypothetical protein
MQIHIARDGQQLGIFSLEEVNRRLAAGTLRGTDQAWYEGAAGWVALFTVPGVSAGVGGGAASPPAPSAVTSTPGAVVPARPLGKNEPLAIWSFVLGIVGLLGFCCGPVLGIAAVICGHLALSKLRTRPDLEGRGLAIAGLIIGYFAIVSWLLYLLFFGGLALLQSLTENMK